MSDIAVVGDTFVYVSSRAKKYPIRPNSSARMSLLAATLCAVFQMYNVRMIRRKQDKILTERKTPMPVKITLAGEKTCKTYMRDSSLT